MIIHSENETKQHRFMSVEAETTNKHIRTNSEEEFKQDVNEKKTKQIISNKMSNLTKKNQNLPHAKKRERQSRDSTRATMS